MKQIIRLFESTMGKELIAELCPHQSPLNAILKAHDYEIEFTQITWMNFRSVVQRTILYLIDQYERSHPITSDQNHSITAFVDYYAYRRKFHSAEAHATLFSVFRNACLEQFHHAKEMQIGWM